MLFPVTLASLTILLVLQVNTRLFLPKQILVFPLRARMVACALTIKEVTLALVEPVRVESTVKSWVCNVIIILYNNDNVLIRFALTPRVNFIELP